MPESFSFYFITHIAVKQFTISQQNHKNIIGPWLYKFIKSVVTFYFNDELKILSLPLSDAIC